jgi:hypothetical protein
MQEVQRNQEELAAAAGSGSKRRTSSKSTPGPPRSLLLVGRGGAAGAATTQPGASGGGAFDAAAALLLRRISRRGGSGGGGKKPAGSFSISNGGLPAPASSDSAAAVASLASAIVAREAGEAAAARAGGGAPPRWRERHGAAGVDAADRRASAIVECGMLLAECVRARLRTLAFCKTRKLAELVAAHASQALREFEEREARGGAAGGGSRSSSSSSSSSKRRKAAATTTKASTSTSTSSSSSQPPQRLLPPLSSRVAAYRAGYDPRARRAIEQALASGRVLGVAATNALELGVDLPLDVTLHLGLPPRAATLAQQSGRAGRRDAAALHIAIAFDGALDQWFVRHPERFFGRAPEPAGGGFDPFRVDAAAAAAAAAPPSPENGNRRGSAAAAGEGVATVDEGVLALHVACAAAECPPLDPSAAGDDARIYFGPRLPAVAAGLLRAGALVGGDWWSRDDPRGGPPPSPPDSSSRPPSSTSAAGGARGRQQRQQQQQQPQPSPPQQQQQQRRSDADRDAAAEAVVARGTPLFFAGVVVTGDGNGSSNGGALAPSAPSRSSFSLPHSTFGLRAIDETHFSIVDDATGALLEEMEASKAFFVV